ncbi:homeodomain-like protein [Mucor ambiguus]|uniref:Homeodomain-like protein n=1 Tax=Mucor ambiguus TaxID=91626 RepID=A0A0C9N2R7_9FUNG|nr:homeodomain-like protein [Mucor ambiguus]
MDLFNNNTWDHNPEDFQHDLSVQQTFSTASSQEHHQIMAGLVQPQPVLKVEGVIQALTPTLSDYDAHYGGLSACPSPYLMSPVGSKRRYSLGGYEPPRWAPYMSPIVTTTRSHSVKRNKRPSTYSRWTLEEDELLRQAVQLHGPHKWSLIASHVPNRTPMQCSTRWLGALNPNIHKGRWTENEDAILRYSVLEYASVTDSEGRVQPIPWNKIAERIPNRTGIQCQARWTEALDPYVRKGKWGLEEDALLRMGVSDFGRCWIRIAETIPGRTQRQCRTRWMQIKYKEDRQQRTEQKRKDAADDTSSQSYITSDEEEVEEVDAQRDKQQQQQRPKAAQQAQQQQQKMLMHPHQHQVPSFFIVDDFDTQLHQPLLEGTNTTQVNQPVTTAAPNIEFLKDDDFFLSTDWPLNAYQQSHNAYL